MSTMTISDLRTKRAHIWDQAKAFLDERRDADQLIATALDIAQFVGETYRQAPEQIRRMFNQLLTPRTAPPRTHRQPAHYPHQREEARPEGRASRSRTREPGANPHRHFPCQRFYSGINGGAPTDLLQSRIDYSSNRWSGCRSQGSGQWRCTTTRTPSSAIGPSREAAACRD